MPNCSWIDSLSVLLLCPVGNKVLQRALGEHSFPESTNQGNYGLRDGHLPYVGDATTISNDAWLMIQQSIIRKVLEEEPVSFAYPSRTHSES